MKNLYTYLPFLKTGYRKIIALLCFVFAVSMYTNAQNVTVNSTAGSSPRNYTSLSLAINAINDGTHQGAITVDINVSLVEGSTPITLNSNDADPATYRSVLIRPSADGITVSGNPANGFGVIQLNGADSVTIDGDNPNTGGINKNLTIINTAAATTDFSSVIRIATSSATPTAQIINIKNCILTGSTTNGNLSGATVPVNSTFGIFAGGNGGATNVSSPTAITNVTTDFARVGTTINGFSVSNNTITQCARGIAFQGELESVCDSIVISGNTIGSTGSNPATTVYSRAIFISGVNAANINTNIMQNIMQYGANNVCGIEVSAPIGSGSMLISNNNINNIYNNSASGDARGIFMNASGAVYTISGNTISNVASLSTSVTSGIRVGTASAAGIIEKNKIFNVTALSNGGASAINLSSPANGMIIRNNFIYDVKTTTGSVFTVARGATGILIASGSNHKIYHNSVNFYNTSTTTFSSITSCISIGNSSQTGIDIRNNILSNRVTGGSSGADVNVALFMPFTASASMDLTLNNNAYFTNNIANESGIAFAGGSAYSSTLLYTAPNFVSTVVTPASNWRSFSSLLGDVNNDNSSLAYITAAPFTSNTDLHIPNATSTPIESGGAALGVTDDIDNAARNLSTPDIGADEFTGAIVDNFPPVISYTLPVTCGTGPRVFTATISDATGVPTSGAGLPTLYWRINGGAWNTAVSVYISPTQYQFTIDPASLAIGGDLVEYYIVAQDLVSPTPNVVAFPSTGAGGYTFSPPAAGTPPTTLASYIITPALAGNYTVGVSGTYITLTAAVAAYNASCLSGAVTFSLLDATYPSETYPITINSNTTASSTNTLTIKPSAGITTTITGDNGEALIKLNGADYIIIDGSNNGSTTRNLTIKNTNANSTAAVIWIGSATASNGATNNTIKNTFISGSASTTSLFGIFSGSGTTLGLQAEVANSINTISNCDVKAVNSGIYLFGKSGAPDLTWTVSNNTMGSTVASEKFGLRAIWLQNINGFTISGNIIAGATSSIAGSAFTTSGISINANVLNGTISLNKISDIKQTNTGGWGANGLLLASTTGSSITVQNNFIWDVAAFGFNGTGIADNGYGIMINAGGGYNIYYNTVLMGTNQTNTASITAAIMISSSITAANTLNIRNNIFANTQTIGTRYAIYSRAAATVYVAIDYNNYYNVGTNLGFLGSARTNLAAWQSATGKDQNSLATNPLFVSGTDLHLQLTSPMNAEAVVIGTITTDIDGGARSGTTPDIGADEFIGANCSGNSGGTATVSTAEICGIGNTVNLAATGFSGGEGISYQWEVSTDNFGSSANLAGQTNPYAAVSGPLNVTTYFRLRVTCAFASSGTSNVVTVVVNNPSVTGVTNGSRCGTGTVTLAATGSAGTTLYWYTTPTGGTSVASGSPYTPTVSANTTYYVSAGTGASSATGLGNTSVPTLTGAFAERGIVFTATQSFVLVSAQYYSPTLNVTNNVTVRLIDNGTGTQIGASQVFSIAQGGSASFYTLPLNLNITPGSYRLLASFSQSVNRISTGVDYTSPAFNNLGIFGTITSGWNAGISTTTYNYFHNIVITGGCESARTAVTATVSAPPSINTPTASPASICQGQSSNLSITSGHAPYTFVWTPGALAGANVTVTPNSSTLYTVTATDNSGGAFNGCATTATVVVNVSASPTLVTVTPNTSSLCAGTPLVLNATGGAINLSPIVNSGTISVAIIDNNAAGSSSALAVAGIPAGATVDSVIVEFNATHTFDGDVAWNLQAPNGEIINLINRRGGGGENYISTRITSDNTALGLASGVVPFTGTFKADLSTTFTSTTQPTPFPTQNTWAPLYTVLNGNWTLRIHDLVGGDIGTLTNWSIKIAYTAPGTYNWTELPNNGTVTPTTGATVTVTPTVNTTYYATVTNGIGCPRKDSAVITISPSTASVTLAAVPSGAVCAGTSVTFTATPTNGGAAPQYTFIKNGTPVQGPSTTASYTYVPANGDVISVDLTSNASCIVGNPFSSSTITMTVNAIPTGTITGAASVCASSTGNIFGVNITPVGGTIVHNWSISGSGSIAGGTNGATVSVTAGASGSFTITDNITRNGCAGVITSVININPNLPVSVSITGDNSGNPICSGTQVIFTASAVNGGASPTFAFYAGNPAVLVQTSASNTYTTTTLNNNDNVYVIVTSNAVCPTGSPATSNTITMTVTGLVTPTASLIVPSACAGQSITLTASSTGGGATPNYTFYLNGGNVQGPLATTTYSFIPVPGDQVYVVVNSSLACASPATGTSSTTTVTVNASPTASISAPCSVLLTGSGQQITLTATGTAGGSSTITGYQWNLGGTPIGGATASTYVATTGGSFTVTITNSNSCSTTSVPFVITASTAALAAGIYSIPGTGCSNFSTIANAITYINANGISGSGGVIFSIAGSHTETAPAGGFRITRTGTVTNQIIFRAASGNPVITASSSHVVGSANDAVFKIVGADYISIRGLTIQENPLAPNTTAGTNNQTEWGIALLQASVTDGPQFDSIAGNTISLNKGYSNSTGIYSNSTHNETTVTIASNITNATGAHSNNKYYSNNISNVNFGIAIIGSNTGGFFDTGNEIGGTGLGNTLTNWGATPVTTLYTNFNTSAVFGILLKDQINETLAFNSLTSATLTGTAGVGFNTRGIWKTYSVTPSSGTISSSITNNNIRITTNYTAAGAYEFNAIRVEVLSLATATLNINTNSVLNSKIAAGGTPTTILINNTSVPGTLNINSNIIRLDTSLATVGTFVGIGNSGVAGVLSMNSNEVKGIVSATALTCLTTASTTTSLSVNSNLIGDAAADSIFSSAGAITGISLTGITTPVKTCNLNVIKNIRTVGVSAGVTALNVSGGTTSCAINSNNVSTIFGAGAVAGIALTGGASTFATANLNTINGLTSSSSTLRGIDLLTGNNIFITNNNISNLTTTTISTIIAGGIYLNGSATITGNNISNISASLSTLNPTILGGIITANAGTYTISQNTINGFVSNANGAGSVNGIYILAGTTFSITKNKIYDLTINNTGGTNLVAGISNASSTSTLTITNNFISDLKHPTGGSTDNIRGISFTTAGATTSYNVYYNTIYLNASSNQTNFGTSGIFHTANGTATSGALTLRNNIIVNNSVSNGTGFSVALRRNTAATLGNYGTTSNNNDFFAPVLYAEGAATYTTLAAMLGITGFSPRESASVSTMPQFVNSTIAPFNLKLIADLNCGTNDLGNNSGILLADDFEGDVRSTTNPFITDIGADEFAGTGTGAGIWRGIDNNWMNVNNWCGEVPTITTNVIIPAGAAFYPIITTTAPVANNVTINVGGTLTINGGGSLSMRGNMANSGTLTNTGRIVLNNTTVDQNFPGNAGTIVSMDTVQIDKSAGTALNLDKSIRIGKALLPNTGKINLNAFNITITSDINGTARIGTVGTTDAFNYNSTGRFVIERYINTGTGGGQHTKSWQLLATPAFGQTIRNAWQEAGSPLGTSPAGLGTIIISDRVAAIANGFDLQTASGGTSMKIYNPAADNYTMVANTNVEIGNPNGYMTFVRGDRNVFTSGGLPNPTTLRITGKVYAPGTDAPVSIAVGNGLFQSVGNPYASAIDFANVGKTAFVQNQFYVWDPSLNSGYGLGGWQTIIFSGGNYVPLLGGTPYYPSGVPVKIQSGQAFFVKTFGGVGTISFTEAAKTGGSTILLRAPINIASITSRLYNQNGLITDGNLVKFSRIYQNTIDADDAPKRMNGGENFGITSSGTLLAMEARAEIVDTDTIFYQMSNLRPQTYHLAFAPENMDRVVSAYLEDRYTNTKTAVSLTDTTHYQFTVSTDAASAASDRFILVFKASPATPATITHVEAYKQDEKVLVKWNVQHQGPVVKYEVERSANGISFTRMGTVNARMLNSGDYEFMDVQPLSGDNYYRIKSITRTNEGRFSNTVKVSIPVPSSITVYPNPVKEDATVNVDLQNKQQGIYSVSITDAAGKTIITQQINHLGGSAKYPVSFDRSVAHGNYILTVFDAQKVKTHFKIIY